MQISKISPNTQYKNINKLNNTSKITNPLNPSFEGKKEATIAMGVAVATALTPMIYNATVGRNSDHIPIEEVASAQSLEDAGLDASLVFSPTEIQDVNLSQMPVTEFYFTNEGREVILTPDAMTTYEEVEDTTPEKIEAAIGEGLSINDTNALLGTNYTKGYAAQGLQSLVKAFFGEEAYNAPELEGFRNAQTSRDLYDAATKIDENSGITLRKGTIVVTGEGSKNLHCGIITSINYDANGAVVSYNVAEANSAMSPDKKGLAVREYKIGGSGKNIQGYRRFGRSIKPCKNC